MSTISALHGNAVTSVSPVRNEQANAEQIAVRDEKATFSPVNETVKSNGSESRANEKPALEESQAQASGQQKEKIDQQRESERLDALKEDKKIEEQQVRDLAIIRDLAARDKEVKAHEQAHMAVGGQYAGPMTLDYKRGPDGNNYAISGEVQISTSKTSDPEMTVAKMETIQRAALAPAEPSSQDIAVASRAAVIEIEARGEIAQVERDLREEDARERSERAEQSDESDKKLEEQQKESSKEDNISDAAETQRQESISELSRETSRKILELERVQTEREAVGFNLDTIA